MCIRDRVETLAGGKCPGCVTGKLAGKSKVGVGPIERGVVGERLFEEGNCTCIISQFCFDAAQ